MIFGPKLLLLQTLVTLSKYFLSTAKQTQYKHDRDPNSDALK